MATGKTCPACGHIHASADTYAVGRFSPNGVVGYRAAYSGALMRSTRDEAVADWCAWLRAKREAAEWGPRTLTPAGVALLEAVQSTEPGHWPGCHREHAACLARRVLEEIR